MVLPSTQECESLNVTTRYLQSFLYCVHHGLFLFLTHAILHQDGHCSLAFLAALRQQAVLANGFLPLAALANTWGPG